MSLCGSCRHARTLATKSGHPIVLCRLSELDDRFARYPTLPKLACPGYSPDKKSAA